MPRTDAKTAIPTRRWHPASHTLIGLLILLVFIVLVERYIGWQNLLRPWLSVEPIPLGFAVVLVMTSYALRALRLQDYFRDAMRGRLAMAYKLMLQHNLLNNLLPMRSGELSFPILMARYFGIGPGRSVPALIWFRVLDLHTLCLLALLAATEQWLDPVASVLILLAFATLPWWLYRFSTRFLRQLSAREGGRLRGLLTRLLSGLPAGAGLFWRSWAWTVANWVVKLAVFAWVLRLFVDVPFAGALLGVAGGEVTSVLPVHGVGGVGTYEAGIIAGLLPFGVSASSALQGGVNLHLFLLGVSLLGGALSVMMSRPRNVTG